jgi:hypothetical protein
MPSILRFFLQWGGMSSLAGQTGRKGCHHGIQGGKIFPSGKSIPVNPFLPSMEIVSRHAQQELKPGISNRCRAREFTFSPSRPA